METYLNSESRSGEWVPTVVETQGCVWEWTHFNLPLKLPNMLIICDKEQIRLWTEDNQLVNSGMSQVLRRAYHFLQFAFLPLNVTKTYTVLSGINSSNYRKLKKSRFLEGRNQHRSSFSPAQTGGSGWAELGTQHQHMCTTACPNSLGYVTESVINTTGIQQRAPMCRTGSQGDRGRIHGSTGGRTPSTTWKVSRGLSCM